jgi:23S rRNA (pseudouridine1915-N3)-methyltransferase
LLIIVKMIKVKIICLGKLKENAFVELEKEYLKRLSPFAKVKLIELSEEPYRSNDNIDNIKLKEAETIKKNIPKDSIVILLEEKGTQRNSIDFATFIERIGSVGGEIVFVIGSGVGLHPSLKEVSNYSVSLSPLTFPHNFARVLLEEQLYRACTIMAGKEYHK